MDDSKFYTSPEMGPHPGDSNQEIQPDPLAAELKDLKNESQNLYAGGEPIRPEELRPDAAPESALSPESAAQNEPGDRELLRNQKEIIDDAHKTLSELESLESSIDSVARSHEINDWLKSALNEAELARQETQNPQDYRLLADRLQIINELTKNGSELVQIFKEYGLKFKEAEARFKDDAKEAIDDISQEVEARQPDELVVRLSLSLDKLRQDKRQCEAIESGFSTEMKTIKNKLDGLNSRYFAPVERLAESQLGDRKEVVGGAGTSSERPGGLSNQQASSDVIRGIKELNGQIDIQANEFGSQITKTLETQADLINQIDTIRFRVRRYERDGQDDSRRRGKAERLDSVN